MTDYKTATAATILERDLTVTIHRWMAKVEQIEELSQVSLTYEQRTRHLPRLLKDLIARLRLPADATPPVSTAAREYGRVRYSQNYTVPMLIEESRLLQTSILGTLHRNQDRLDAQLILVDVIAIADECEAQLKETMQGYMDLKQEDSEKGRSEGAGYGAVDKSPSRSSARII